ncbi:ABC-three component system middle component 5 [Hymenobacter negativus]|uniref:Uncharacterized protein n=1 Tax=Hymenobacter negativus TaxID=2795026 RepID=A0ABS0Q5Y6_9BACT|nr:ABC-three component system middle component 5 [Hymenobacter negativus]MBH8557907.1 hypothetical protein [Hymenobacter negativus]
MLVYHPAFDLYHAVCRFLKLLYLTKDKSYATEHIKLIDYFVVFPGEITKMQLPLEYRSYRKLFKVNPYEDVYNGPIVFRQLQGYQDSALQAMSAYAFIDPLLYRKGEVKLSDKFFGEEIDMLVSQPIENAVLAEFVNQVLLKMPYEGSIGLKERSKLF